MSGAKLLTVDIGGTKVAWGLAQATPDGVDIQGHGTMHTNAHAGNVLERICEKVRELNQAHTLNGVAIASAGVIDPRTGKVVSATNTMPGWAGTELGKAVAEDTGLPVHVINDVHAHGLGEATAGAGRGAERVLSVAVGTGIGGALIVSEQIDFGAHYLAGHYGHIHHHMADSMRCSCGRMGHIEAICSGSGITNWYNFRRSGSDPQVANGKQLQDLAEAGNELAQTVFEESAYALGQSLGSLANCVDPTVIVISGSMTRSGESWWHNLRRGYRDSAMDPLQEVPIRLGDLGSDAPLVGAAVHFVRQETRNGKD